jgi:hypothetical protein
VIRPREPGPARFVTALVVAALASAGPARGQEASVVVAGDALPAAGAAWHGEGPHLFQEGSVALTCSSHGGFAAAVEPPRRPGATAVSEYAATFTGVVTLAPPAVAAPATHALSVPARMVERITLAARRGGTRVFDAELTALDLQGSGMPAGMRVRESPTQSSAGRYMITSVRHGFRVESFYDVWLDVSLDDGRTWHPAQAPVRMWLTRP